MKVRVVAYKERIVIVPDKPEDDIFQGRDEEDTLALMESMVNEEAVPTISGDLLWVPTSPDSGGCVVGPTETQLGVSEEALALMEDIERNHDAIGDISWWELDDGTHAFSWWGPIYRIIDPDNAEADREFRLTPSIIKSCTIIPNDVPDEAKAVLDTQDDPVFWKEPFLIDNAKEGT